MPSKLISGFFVSAIALTVIAPTAQAKLSSTSDSTPNYEIQNKLAGRRVARSFGQNFSEIPGLNLTSQQENQLQEVQATMSSRLGEILTDEQLETFKKLMASGKSPRRMASSLSWGQMRKMQKLMSWQKKQLKSILDEDQMKLVEQFRKKRK
ncbi:MAG: Spy/CpxP family protein refolding chaperone [Calothrix sp. MO_167.B42]|nr:Spy/CpxP family protein refolding chaperone [Calothrix sp. MO_167.B42]